MHYVRRARSEHEVFKIKEIIIKHNQKAKIAVGKESIGMVHECTMRGQQTSEHEVFNILLNNIKLFIISCFIKIIK